MITEDIISKLTEPSGDEKKDESIKAAWTRLEGKRSMVLMRAWRCSELTIPALLPRFGHSESMELPTPFQALGARCVNHLATKLLLALLPANTPFFKESVDEFTIEKLAQEPGAMADVEKALGKVERAVMTWIEQSKIRPTAFEALKQLIVAGNVLLYIPDKGGIKAYKLDQYVCKRDPMGNVIEGVLKEMVHPVTLPAEVRGLVTKQGNGEKTVEKVDMYTHIIRRDDHWEISQEVEGHPITGFGGNVKLDDLPFLFLRWTSIPNEDYGRGLVEEYLGDFISLDGLWESMVLGSAAASKVLFLVNPNGTTTAKALRDTPNGGFSEGRKEDVTCLQVEKYADFKMVAELIDRLERRISYAFLLNSSVQRDAERVTAEEVRLVANELEDSLGGVYTVLAQDFQLPFVQAMIRQLTKKNKIPKIPKYVSPIVVTGLEALGRGHDLNKLNTFSQQLTVLGPETVKTWLKVDNYIKRVGTAIGMDTDGLVKTPDEVAAENQQNTGMGLVGSVAPGVAQEMVKGVMNAQAQGAGAPSAG